MTTGPKRERTRCGAPAPALEEEGRPVRKSARLSRWFVPAFAAALAMVALVACGDDDSDTTQQAAATAPAVALEPTPTPTAEPTPTAPPGLAPECLPGGAIEDAATVSSCAQQAMRQMTGFSFEGEFNLLAVFSGLVPEDETPAAGAEGLVRLNGAIVPPDRMQVEITFGAEGEALRIAVVVIGADTYFRDPEAAVWFKGAPPDADFLSTVQLVGMLQTPRESGGTLEAPVQLDDGAVGYVLSYDQAGQQSGMEGMGLPGNLVLVVGADDFLTREVRVTLEDAGGDAPNVIAVRYHGYDAPAEIEPPAQYMTIPE